MLCTVFAVLTPNAHPPTTTTVNRNKHTHTLPAQHNQPISIFEFSKQICLRWKKHTTKTTNWFLTDNSSFIGIICLYLVPVPDVSHALLICTHTSPCQAATPYIKLNHSSWNKQERERMREERRAFGFYCSVWAAVDCTRALTCARRCHTRHQAVVSGSKMPLW